MRQPASSTPAASCPTRAGLRRKPSILATSSGSTVFRVRLRHTRKVGNTGCYRRKDLHPRRRRFPFRLAQQGSDRVQAVCLHLPLLCRAHSQFSQKPASGELASETFTGLMIVAFSELARGWRGAGQWVRSRSGVPLAALRRRQGSGLQGLRRRRGKPVVSLRGIADGQSLYKSNTMPNQCLKPPKFVCLNPPTAQKSHRVTRIRT